MDRHTVLKVTEVESSKRTPKEGEIWTQDGGRVFKVMAVADGYVMARFKGCIPFVSKLTEFLDRSVPLEDAVEK